MNVGRLVMIACVLRNIDSKNLTNIFNAITTVIENYQYFDTIAIFINSSEYDGVFRIFGGIPFTTVQNDQSKETTLNIILTDSITSLR